MEVDMKKEIKILLVDDEVDFLQPMAFWFQSKGYSTITATSGEEAIQKVKEESPDIIFLDLNIPEMDGIQTLKKIREFNKDLPAIIVSAYVDPIKMKEAEPYHISGVFYKGRTLEEGLALLESALRRHKKLQKE
ncbi:MAG: hypothetical protein DRP68_01555 [Candidatus Omnitrophota bacterium]|nr:MAG: hypothetical protein DRP68_01555 [Candidatus Omnitrophota bacterium]